MLFKNFDKFSSVLHFSTLKLLLFTCRKSLRFLARIFWNSAFFPRNVREKRKTQTKNYHWSFMNSGRWYIHACTWTCKTLDRRLWLNKCCCFLNSVIYLYFRENKFYMVLVCCHNRVGHFICIEWALHRNRVGHFICIEWALHRSFNT